MMRKLARFPLFGKGFTGREIGSSTFSAYREPICIVLLESSSLGADEARDPHQRGNQHCSNHSPEHRLS